MSRIGKKFINIPETIETSINGSDIKIQGPKGELIYTLPKCIKIKENNSIIKLMKNDDTKKTQALYGLSRTIVNNMVIGVSNGFSKQLEIHGVGYRCQMESENLILNVGYSHPVVIKPESNISIKVENNNFITITGINKELVGQTAAKIRSIRPPEPYKGKGIRYYKEIIKRKVGKAGK
uniref:Large ribosomal subunit protein uL6c n=1 Tax=Gelidium kathyanniae TaxID=2483893 RepID=A0A3G2QYG9_9FLOR|nr:ribosomal protein L6 [Gelidium kathyanniae]AYO28019.1 ribosomal protein L6 [Gelidium kathyanniae]